MCYNLLHNKIKHVTTDARRSLFVTDVYSSKLLKLHSGNNSFKMKSSVIQMMSNEFGTVLYKQC